MSATRTKSRSARRWLPLDPLLDVFRRSAGPPAPTARSWAVATAAAHWLNEAAVDAMPAADFRAAVAKFYRAVDPTGWHPQMAADRAELVRHAAGHLLRGPDPLEVKFARCAEPAGAYFVLGLGPGFWAAVVKAADPDGRPDWTADVAAGLARVGRLGGRPPPYPGGLGAAVLAYADILSQHPDLSATDLDRFFRRVARMRGRELPADDGPPAGDPAAVVPDAVRRVRADRPLRSRLKAARRGLGFPPVDRSAAAAGLTRADDADHPALPPADRERLFADVVDGLRDRFRVHPLEAADVLAEIGGPRPAEPATRTAPRFAGFCGDTFRFLADLADNNYAVWLAGQRGRYRFAVREPLVELCRALAGRYVGPVLGGRHGWAFDTDPRPGKAVGGLAHTEFGGGTGGPYRPALAIAFRPAGAGKRSAHLFVRADAGGLTWGFRAGKPGNPFRAAVPRFADLLARAVRATGAADDLRFCPAPGQPPVRVNGAADLRAWALGRDPEASRSVPANDPLLRSDDLVNDILLTFDKLLPLVAAAVDPDPAAVCAGRIGEPPPDAPFDRPAFRAATGLSDAWVDRTLGLLKLKKQLVLQGVPGTGKTHVARSLARLLTADRPDAVRLVQFHPGYSYEEFVEGIRPKAAADGVTYPVADGLLVAFADRAAGRPGEPHVLVVDEVNRGNLPRVFGELLFLLEYRDQAVTLPYSGRAFRLPPNLYLVCTMNPADRSVAALDRALRRRFGFVDLPPDADVLEGWLRHHPPASGGPKFAARVVRLFTRLNRRLSRDLGPDAVVGHGVFMVPDLTPDTLSAVWDHHVLPLLADAPGRAAGYDLASLLADKG